MKTAFLTAGAVGATAAVKSGTAEAKEAQAAQKSGSYQETEHVRTYYKLARF